jgi:hypothetical protein
MTGQTEISPFCSQCSTQMLLVRIFPDTQGYEQRTYECPWCPHEMTEIVRSILRPTSAHVATTSRNEKIASASPGGDEPVTIQVVQLTVSDLA